MKRLLAIAIAGIVALVHPDLAPAQSPERTGSYRRLSWRGFQNPDGGFAPKVGQPSSLGSTSSAIRTLGYTGGSIPDVTKCIAYVKSCYDPTTGGFAPSPGGKPDVSSTAIGLMAVAALKLDITTYAEGAIGFFSKNAKAFEEVRMAAAGMESVKATSPDFPRWIAQVKEGENPDGTYEFGPGSSLARPARRSPRCSG